MKETTQHCSGIPFHCYKSSDLTGIAFNFFHPLLSPWIWSRLWNPGQPFEPSDYLFDALRWLSVTGLTASGSWILCYLLDQRLNPLMTKIMTYFWGHGINLDLVANGKLPNCAMSTSSKSRPSNDLDYDLHSGESRISRKTPPPRQWEDLFGRANATWIGQNSSLVFFHVEDKSNFSK